MNTLRKLFRFALASALTSTIALGSAAAGEFAVVVNSNNAFNDAPQATRSLVGRLYLKQLTAWPDGSPAKVLAAPASSPTMAGFREHVLEMNEAELAGYWLSVKQKTGETPPREVASANIMVKLLAQNPGSIGVMSRAEAATAGDGVRILFEFDAK